MLSITPDKYRFSLLFTAQPIPTIRTRRKFFQVIMHALILTPRFLLISKINNAITVYTKNEITRKLLNSLRYSLSWCHFCRTPTAPVHKKAARLYISHRIEDCLSSAFGCTDRRKHMSNNKTPMICSGLICSCQIIAPEIAGMVVDNDTITLVYAIGPICIARNVKNCWSIVTIPNAKPSQSENDEIVLTPPQSQSTAVATSPVAMLKNRISFCFTL